MTTVVQPANLQSTNLAAIGTEVVTHPKLSLEEFLVYDDGTGQRFELDHGDLVTMGVGTGKHGGVSKFLEGTFDQESQRLERLWTAQRNCIAIQSPRAGRWDTARVPDVVVLSIAQWEALADEEAVIRLNEPAPFLVVEVVSESTVRTDYRTKLSEYAVLDIPEYWIVDPLKQKVTVGYLDDGLYDTVVYTAVQIVESKIFPELKLRVDQVLAGKL
jgi:Uma2 family endonuclease